MRRWAIINALLGLLVGLIGFEIVRTWSRSLPLAELQARASAPVPEPEKRDKDRGSRRAGADKKEARAAAESPAALVKYVADHDLFDPTRQKPSEETFGKAANAPAVVKPELNPPPGVSVVGIRIHGRDREAFIRETNQNNKQRRVRPGDQIVGYTVKTIGRSGLLLTSPSGDAVPMDLSIEKDKAKAPKPPAPVARPGGPPAGPLAGAVLPSPAAGVGGPAAPSPVPPVSAQPQQVATPPAMPPATVPPAATNALEALRGQRERARLGAKR